LSSADRDADARRLSTESYARADPTGWFDQLYRESAVGDAIVPWDRETPNVLLVEWAAARDGAGQSAVVVGCGLGRDSEFLASLGYRTSAFDISETAVQGARERHPESAVRYEAADLRALPDHYRAAFDLVVESYTVQSLPDLPRTDAIAGVRTLVAPGGTLLVIAAARDDDTPVDGPPWPLTRAEVESFASAELRAREVTRLVDPEGKSRWRAEFGRDRG
jgi:SAM-dependent methyltransferase